MFEIDEVQQTLPEDALTAFALEVVQRVAKSLQVITSIRFEPTAAEIEDLCMALTSTDPNAGIHMIEAAQSNGASYDTLCLTYLSSAARRLGEWWDEDRVSFYDVTVAAGRVYAILRILRQERPLPPADLRRSAIFASVPGEDHTLGITIAADLARDKGWDIDLLVGLTQDQLVAEIERNPAAVIGLSASGERTLPALIRLIVALRVKNPHANIMVCGQITTLPYNLKGLTDADAVACDFAAAMAHLEGVVRQGALRIA